MSRRCHVSVVCPALLVVAVLAAACGEDGDQGEADAAAGFPTQPIEYAIPFDPGGESDVTARLQQGPLEEALGTSIVINYQPGGGGALGWSELVRTEPDGHTIMGHNLPHIILQPMQRQDAGYETEDLQQVYIFQNTPNALAVGHDSPYKTFEDFAQEASQRILTVGGSGDFTANHIGTLMLAREADLNLTYIPFSGTGAVLPALLGGHIDAVMTYTPPAIDNADQMRTLAIASAERMPQPDLEDIPTFVELGVDLVDGAYRGVAVPPDTSEEVVNALADAFADVNQDSDMVETMTDMGFELVDYGPEESLELTRERAEVYRPLMEDLGLTD